ncbi:amidohydrolase [Clostridium sporogenes]|uniref:Amidohydrolase n=1 Tax=Clostridium botulinum TaxID=1491 RepID=A0A6M0SZP4_CLOBO|nr:amidohydrolase [Clostridium sporogenes]NFA60976.1 amidohydrolase [Clostridium botulinum]NFI73571.1 amidohydrolase [Clostridium sporogenes]NFL73529.1 amidohydrolase [Clostridium sporogenes]NFM25825.1 amidohydrolase [Clostridium sporogenes]NFP61181.1 amidohydrolase [Clostridium sporogenes]
MLLIKNGKIHTMTGEIYVNDCILINNGKIEKIAKKIDVSNEDLQVIDAKGGWVMPGFIDAHCHIGIMEEGIKFEGMDLNEYSSAITPHLRAIDGINPRDRAFKSAIETGITTAMTGMGSSNPIGGQFAIIKTYGKSVDEMLVKAPAALKIAFGENPKSIFGKKGKMPITRMGTVALIRETLYKARNYKNRKEQALREGKVFDIDIKMESIMPVLNGEIPLKAHAHRSDDILTAIRIAKEFGVKLTIDHGTEANLVIDYIKESGFPVIAGPNMNFRGKVETQNRSYDTAKILQESGILYAIITDHPVVPIEFLPLSAALAVKNGLQEDEALKAITINAAKILGIDNRVGTLEEGKDADICIYNDNPLNIISKNIYTIISGNIVYDFNIDQ